VTKVSIWMNSGSLFNPKGHKAVQQQPTKRSQLTNHLQWHFPAKSTLLF